MNGKCIYVLISIYLGDTSIKLNKIDCAVLVTQTPDPLTLKELEKNEFYSKGLSILNPT